MTSRWQSNNKKNMYVHKLMNPLPFPCCCGRDPSIVKASHPGSGKPNYYVVKCSCGNSSIYAKQKFKAVLDWNINPNSKDPETLYFPGLQIETKDIREATDQVKDEMFRIDMVLRDKHREKLSDEQWNLVQAKKLWCSLLLSISRRKQRKTNNVNFNR